MDGTSYRYERRGLLAAVADDDLTTIAFGYDADGNRARLTYPSGRLVQTTFDFADRPIAASSNGNPVISSASYLPFGPMTSMTYANGTTKTMQYDSRYRPQENRLTTGLQSLPITSIRKMPWGTSRRFTMPPVPRATATSATTISIV